MRIALLLPGKWQAEKKFSMQWERSVSLLADGLRDRGTHVSVFQGPFCAYSESEGQAHDASEVQGYLDLGELFARAEEFDIIHNHNAFLPLTYSRLIDTPVLCAIHGRMNPELVPAYRKYNDKCFYVSSCDADRSAGLHYIATIRDALDLSDLDFNETADDYLLFTAAIGPESGAGEAINVARESGLKLVMAGEVTDSEYFRSLEPLLDGRITYAGALEYHQLKTLSGRARAVLYTIQDGAPIDLSPLEANACGTPIVAFIWGAAPEIVEHGVNGYLVSSVEEAVKAVKNLHGISRKDCRKFVEEKFSSNRMIDEYLSLYEIILEKNKREDHRPWGYYKILHEVVNHKVKEIVMYPHKRLSLQRHRHRAEHWMVVTGEAEVRVGQETFILKGGDSVDIPTGALHRIGNRGDDLMVFIEVQTGSYFGEDDIERFEDDFGRV